MKNDELVQRLKAQLNDCAGFDGDEIADDRRTALDYYFQRPNGTEIPGRATVVSGDVSAMVEANLASMMEAFGSDSLIDFDAFGPEDEDQAQLEADTVQHFVMKENAGRWQLSQAIKDTLLLRNGWMKVWVEETRTVTFEEYRDLQPEALPDMLERGPGVECEIVQYEPEDGYTKIRCTYVSRRFRAEALPPENVFYPSGYDGCDFRAIQDIPFIAERHVEPRYELHRRGFPAAKVDVLKAYRSDSNITGMARNPRQLADHGPGVDAKAELVEWYEAYVMINGERHKVCFAENEILKRAPASLVPYATGQCFIAPHRLTGVSVWDKVKQSQDVNTALQRALLDNVAATSKQRTAYLDGKVNVDDIADGRVNGGIRVKANVPRVTDAVMPFAVPDTSSGIQAAIQHQRSIRTELGGAALDMQSGEMQLNRQAGSQGIDRIFSVAEALAGHMTGNIAQTLIRSTFLLAHATLREYFDEPVQIKQQGRWLSATPSQWPVRERLTVKVGMSPGERSRRQAAIDKLLQAQISLAQLGMDNIMVNSEGYYTLLMDWARVSEVPSPERYFIDPRSEEAQKAMQAKEQQEQQMQAQQEQLVAQAIELEKLRTAFDKYKTDAELQYKYWADVLRSEIEEAKIAGGATVELLKAKANGQSKAGPAAPPEPAAD